VRQPLCGFKGYRLWFYDIIASNQKRMGVPETIQEVNNVEYLPILLLFIAIFLCLIPLFKRKPKTTPKKPRVSEYDSEGYNRQGYNEVGRNRQGKYNRYYNVKCYKTDLYSEEGFLDIRDNPLYLTNHARERMYERMGINDSYRMEELAFEAYQFGKSKLQLMKSERGIIEEKEQQYGDSVILIYRGFCYVFTENNGLKTVYKNDRVRA
jgi:hypothetical protein